MRRCAILTLYMTWFAIDCQSVSCRGFNFKCFECALSCLDWHNRRKIALLLHQKMWHIVLFFKKFWHPFKIANSNSTPAMMKGPSLRTDFVLLMLHRRKGEGGKGERNSHSLPLKLPQDMQAFLQTYRYLSYVRAHEKWKQIRSNFHWLIWWKQGGGLMSGNCSQFQLGGAENDANLSWTRGYKRCVTRMSNVKIFCYITCK